MNKTESLILSAFSSSTPRHFGPQSIPYSSWHRDTVALSPRGRPIYFLWGTVVARIADFPIPTLELGVCDGAWKTKTTKSRINAFAAYYNLPRIYQKNHQWYWSDGQPYTDTRDFPIHIAN